MRLNSIKLSGFKSFVDSTHLLFQSNLTAIVGPNGCGKSNIVDAIYCVLGSKSRDLRAESMSDVIFNGTTERKPVSQASIELIFDNTEGRIGGEYAQYPEISIRRELGRDGQSNYYLNGMRCRRRDITDIFLGTGLGHNSYAIIEQGMISRLIEAKPEELRAHVEEAAGTSKYKERRRETENRIKHTRENLDRLNDLREEQAKQLNHLQRQASAAEKYKTLKTEQRRLRAEHQLILWQGLNQQIAVFDQQINTHETLYEAKIAELREVDKEIECQRSLRTEHHDVVDEVQSQYYSLGAEINRIEQNISHTKERKKQLENDYLQLETSYQELKQAHFDDQELLNETNREIANIEILFQEVKAKNELKQSELKIADEKMHSWQEKWDLLSHAWVNISKQAEVEKTKILHLEQKRETLVTRLARIKEEQITQDSKNLIQEVSVLQEEQRSCQLEVESLQQQLDLIQENIQKQKSLNQQAQSRVGEFTKELRDLQAKHASMQAIQQIALGKSDAEISTWLTSNRLQGNQRLAEGLEVEPGWEMAVEMVLAKYLDAICIEDFSLIPTIINDFQHADISFFNTNAHTKNSTPKKITRLVDKVKSNLPIANLLQHIYVANNLTEALENLPLLDTEESFITCDGIWVSNTWLRVARIATEKTGVLQREHEIKEIQQQIHQQQTQLSNQELLYHEAQEKLNLYLEEREITLHQLQSSKAKNSELVAQINAKKSYIDQLNQKQAFLLSDLTEQEQQLNDVLENLENARNHLININEQVSTEETNRQALLLERESLRVELDQVRHEAASCRQKSDEAQVRVESMRSQIHFLTQNLERSERQLTAISERRNSISDSLNNINDPLPEFNITLQQTLEKRVIVEEALQQARQTLDAFENSLTNLEKHRHHIEQNSHEIRNSLEQMRLECQSLRVKLITYVEQIEAAGFSLEILQRELAENAELSVWEENLAKVDSRIQRLGPINLAAIDEYASLAERKEYLDKQHDDLVEALETLENAIRKIDKETRMRFKETFAQLNNSFKIYFQQIFGGGESNLELTSDDLLETGVIVKAQPPGKRNTSIHLLSGGEKALTAIALVFAIFSLNPAPFCVLDEVDAPLDDANVVRFCNLVRKMSEKIQFIFISHNKITIEMGQQLAGVTMNEPGVSRLVSVDIEQAITMANA